LGRGNKGRSFAQQLTVAPIKKGTARRYHKKSKKTAEKKERSKGGESERGQQVTEWTTQNGGLRSYFAKEKPWQAKEERRVGGPGERQSKVSENWARERGQKRAPPFTENIKEAYLPSQNNCKKTQAERGADETDSSPQLWYLQYYRKMKRVHGYGVGLFQK